MAGLPGFVSTSSFSSESVSLLAVVSHLLRLHSGCPIMAQIQAKISFLPLSRANQTSWQPCPGNPFVFLLARFPLLKTVSNLGFIGCLPSPMVVPMNLESLLLEITWSLWSTLGIT